MTDVLTITVPLTTRAYPSVNHTGANSHRAGRKSPEYIALFQAVKDAAEAEMVRTGWQKATWDVDATLVLVRSNRRRFDPSNLGKCENDALTAAGVWDDDNLGNGWHAYRAFDPDGPDRVVIVLRRLYPPIVATETTTAARLRAQDAAKPPKASGRTPKPPVDPVAAISGRQWLMNGNPMTPAQIATAKKQLGIA